MVKYYVLFKRANRSGWVGAIPVRAGVSLAKLRSSLRGKRKGVRVKVVSESQLKAYLRSKLRRVVKSSVRRKKRVVRRKRRRKR